MRSRRPIRPEPRAGSAPPSVIAGYDAQDAVDGGDGDVHGQRLRVLGGVGDQLGDGVVGSYLDPVGELVLDLQIEGDGQRRTPRERPQRQPESAGGEDRWVESSRDLPHLLERAVQAVDDTGELGTDVCVRRRERRLGGAHLEGKGDEPLLDAVVQVSLDLSSRLVGCGDDAGARRRELGAAVRVGDRGVITALDRDRRELIVRLRAGRTATP
jgi:hypothetical protein